MSRSWKIEVRIVLALLSLGALLGLLVNQWQFAILVVVCGYLFWHLSNLIVLVRLVKQRKRLRPPFVPGIWAELYQGMASLQDRARKRKRGLSRFAARFREAAAALPDAAIIIGKHLEIEWANPAAQGSLGILCPTMEGQYLYDVVSDPVLKEYLDGADYSRPLEFSPPNNKAIVLSLAVTPFGKKKQHLLIGRDITQIYNLNRTRRDFVSNVSHELRTPLTVISGFLETLIGSEKKTPSQTRALELMSQQTERMELIISDLLALSRLEMEEDNKGFQPVPVPELIQTIVDEARTLSDTQQHVFELACDQKLWMLGDKSALRSAISNLIFNAVQHTLKRSKVIIQWSKDLDDLRLCVQDTGEGIAARHIPRLTERFYRVDAGRSRHSGGTGLGLAIVKHVVNRHGGELKIESKEGKGSTFSCNFPVELAVQRPETLQVYLLQDKDSPADGMHLKVASHNPEPAEPESNR